MTLSSDCSENALAALGDLTFTLALAIWAGVAAGCLHLSGLTAGWAELAAIFAIIHADPAGAVRKRLSLRCVFVKLCFGAGLGFFAWLLVTALLSGIGLDPGNPAAWHSGLVLVLLIVPLLTAVHVMETRLADADRPDANLSSGAKPRAVLPVGTMVTMTLTLAIPGGLWLLKVPAEAGFVVLTAGVLMSVIETWTNQETEGGRPQGRAQARSVPGDAQTWEAVKHALRQSIASAFFVGGLVFVSIEAARALMPAGHMNAADPAGIVTGSALLSGMVLLAASVLMAFGAILAALAAQALGRRHKADLATVEELQRRAMARLFMGSMRWVDPGREFD